MNVFMPLAVAFLFTLCLTPVVKNIALRTGAVDRPGERTVHSGIMPRLGGLAIIAGFWTAVFLTQRMTSGLWGFFAGSMLILAVGIWDDAVRVKPWMKLVFQVLAAVCVMAGGIQVSFVTNIFFGGVLPLGWIGYPMTLIWIVGVTNAVNLVDGLDGLAAGVSAIAALTIGVIAWMEGMQTMGMLALILAMSVLGFLKYNFYPAKIFMGDTGSLFLGYALSVLAIVGLTKTVTVISLFLPVVVLGIPILDTAYAIVRRYSSHKPIFSADKDHLHHRLMAVGLSHRNTVLVIYGVSAILGASAVWISILSAARGMIVMAVVTAAVFFLANRVGILSRKAIASKPDAR
ncbi:MAG: undecaprenyl/decaprenyl-phosphate alpha-N-acetylglucosaminyl 1-phosphate transferase [Peptococcaceae bacterium]|nr:undecaprenyl/decaprenyl-phosphate alpha-N-acetylglucosaminyl 1-phosphate transferase [Peptococcaceae bacterium]